MSKRRKIWVHAERDYRWFWVTAHEPEWMGGTWVNANKYLNSWTILCREQVKKAFGVEVPPWPQLLEIEFEVKDTKIWKPIKKGSES